MGLELQLLGLIQQIRTPLLDRVMVAVTTLGNGGILWLGLTAVLLLIPKTRRTGAAMAVSLALEVLCCNVILKPLAARARPCEVNQAVELLVTRPTDFSFPSGHTGASFAAVSALYFTHSPLWIPAGVLALLIAFSRLYLYVHYPTDVLAGALLGVMLGWLGTWLVRCWVSSRSLQRRIGRHLR